MREAVATSAGEEKRIREHGCELVLQRLAEQPACAIKTGAHCLRSQCQKKSGFLNAHFLDVPHDKDDAKRLRQVTDGSLQEAADSSESGRLFGIRLVCAERSDHAFDDFRVHGGSPFPAASQRLVQRDPGEPGRQPRLRAEFGQMGEGVDIGLLKYVLRLGVVIQDGAGDPVKPLIVTLDDQPECGGVSMSRVFNQPRVVKVLDSHCLGGSARLHHRRSRCISLL
ncbi:UNVERIFIED_ORG: hypothetical protein GGD47_000342 [Rhizobium etli]